MELVRYNDYLANTVDNYVTGFRLLTWINFNPSVDM